MNKLVYEFLSSRTQFKTHPIIRVGDIVSVDYFTENKYRQIFNGVCIKISGDKYNRRIKVLNTGEKVESIFFLASPNIIRINILVK